MSEPLPCPFCGSTDISDGESLTEDAEGVTYTQSECFSCKAVGPAGFLKPGQVDYGSVVAIEAWNRRALAAPTAPTEPVAWMTKDGEIHKHECWDYLEAVPLYATPPSAAQPEAVGRPVDATAVEWKDAVWRAYMVLRRNDNTIPSEWLEFMKAKLLTAAPTTEATSSPSDAERLDWIAIHGSFGLDSVTGLPGGNGQKQVAATRAAIDAAIATKGGKL